MTHDGSGDAVLIEVIPTGGEELALHIRGRGSIDGPSKVVATLLAALEGMTGVPADDYAAAIVEQAGL